jgi:hypothetical protein
VTAVRWAGLAVIALWACGALAEMPRRLDPGVALARELAQAVAKDSNAALVNFIARHPHEALTDEARARLAARPSQPSGSTGPDAAIYADFDAARLAGPKALDGFALRYSGHPLAAEALRSFWIRPGPP